MKIGLDVLTVGEAAEELRVHPRTVHRLVETGDLAGIRVRSRIRIRAVDLREFVGRQLPMSAAATSKTNGRKRLAAGRPRRRPE
ncbi:MAG: helix-turn-helix domain-containing protein [Pirellulales bacterium]|nr:helix-turn-helix domain-containing protein [Pirellulales bacterium]